MPRTRRTQVKPAVFKPSPTSQAIRARHEVRIHQLFDVPGRIEIGPVRIPRRARVTRAAMLEQSALAAGKFAGNCPIHAGVTQRTEIRNRIPGRVNRPRLSGAVRNCGIAVYDVIEESEYAVARARTQHRGYDIGALPVEHLVPQHEEERLVLLNRTTVAKRVLMRVEPARLSAGRNSGACSPAMFSNSTRSSGQSIRRCLDIYWFPNG